MFQMLIQIVFTIVTKLFSLILQPILSMIMIVFPDLSNITTNMINFLNNYVFDYVSFALKMLENLTQLPHWLVVFLFDYFVIKITLYLTVQAIRFGIVVYNKFKP